VQHPHNKVVVTEHRSRVRKLWFCLQIPWLPF